MATAPEPMDEWKTLPWPRLERAVFKLQTRIYQAAQRGDVKTVHQLQRLLTRSWAAKCLAVRRVTQDNQGKKTAGVDGVSALTPLQRWRLARTLRLDAQSRPTRRVWIPKPGGTERRPLGIPVMRDRAAQALLKLALEPEWEARFEPNSYGFRPGRSCHDAIAAIFNQVRQKPKYVLDADLTKCFDRIDHAALLAKLQTTPTFRRTIRGWLKAGVLDGATLLPTEAGTPQGGVVSPLLANIALHGLETAIRAAFPPSYTVITPAGEREVVRNWQPAVIRYADDFVVLHEDRAVIEQATALAAAWLAKMGLALHPSKTRLTHTLTPIAGAVGFDFLGFTVRQFPVGKTHSGKRANGAVLGFKTIIRPSKAAQQRHLLHCKAIVRRHQNAPQAALVARLNPVIRGWSRYYAAVAAKVVFNKMDHLLWLKLRRWAKRRHPRQRATRWVARYWHRQGARTWSFSTKEGHTLLRHADTPIVRYPKVQNTRSPYDGDWSYWATRLGRHPALSAERATLLRKQRGTCPWCRRYFRDGDLLEVDHIDPHGGNRRANLQLLHRHCHDRKTATDGSHPRWTGVG